MRFSSGALGLDEQTGMEGLTSVVGALGGARDDSFKPGRGLIGPLDSCQFGRMGYSKAELAEGGQEIALLRSIYGMVENKEGDRDYVRPGKTPSKKE
jgi:hypothetical protein